MGSHAFVHVYFLGQLIVYKGIFQRYESQNHSFIQSFNKHLNDEAAAMGQATIVVSARYMAVKCVEVVMALRSLYIHGVYRQ